MVIAVAVVVDVALQAGLSPGGMRAGPYSATL